MKLRHISSLLCLALLGGCVASQAAQLQTDEQQAEAVFAATTQASAAAKEALAQLPPGAARDQSLKIITAAEKNEQTARLALTLAEAALNAAQKKAPADPALTAAVAAAVGAIPSPWTPVLASLLPAAIPLLVSVVQSIKLGKAHQTVTQITQQLNEHKAALANLTGAAAPAKLETTDAHG